jgi:hypothetical protein
MEESDRLFTCGHCRVRLYMAGGRVAKYCLPPGNFPENDELLSLPYWHIRGAYYSVCLEETRKKFVDTSLLAFSAARLPVSLGVRTQAMTLRPAVKGIEGAFVRPDVPFGDMIERAERTMLAFGGADRRARVFHRSFVGEAVSLIYTPVRIEEGRLIDAVLNRPFPSGGTQERGAFSPLEDKESWRVRFLPVVCPNCGWDMPGEKKSEILPCPNCQRVWQAGASGYTPVSFGTLKGEGDVHLPFWSVSVEADGVKLESYADLVELANLSILPRDEWRVRKPVFWAPAFRCRPGLFLRLSRQLSLRPPEGEEEVEVPQGALHPATVGHLAAVESIKLTLADAAAPRREILPVLERLAVKVLGRRLNFLPFRIRGGDLVQERTGMSLRRNALRD